MSLASIASQLVGIGKQLLPQLIPGAGAAISLATKVADAIDDVKDVLGTHDQAAAVALTADLRAKANAAIDKTIGRLRG